MMHHAQNAMKTPRNTSSCPTAHVQIHSLLSEDAHFPGRAAAEGPASRRPAPADSLQELEFAAQSDQQYSAVYCHTLVGVLDIESQLLVAGERIRCLALQYV